MDERGLEQTGGMPRLLGMGTGEEWMAIINEIMAERRRQDAKWGEQNHEPPMWIAILIEELGEAAKAFLQGNAAKYRHEMIQVAAVAVAALEAPRPQ